MDDEEEESEMLCIATKAKTTIIGLEEVIRAQESKD